MLLGPELGARSAKPQPPKRATTVHSWRTGDSVEWLKSKVGLPEYANLFEAAAMNGAKLAAVDHSRLTSLGITSHADREVILARLQRLLLPSADPEEEEARFEVGMRVAHPSRGQGVVVAILPDDERGKPYVVGFDLEPGQEHHYSLQSLAKLRVWTPGMRIIHPVRGFGVLISIDRQDVRDKAYTVQFDDGQIHHYSQSSAAKLKVRDFEPDDESFAMLERHQSAKLLGIC
jgi:hypothetical protein